MLRTTIFLTTLLTTLNSCVSLKPAVVQLTTPVDHAEGPVWDHRTNTLYYVDIHAGGLYAYNWKTDDLRHANLNGDLAVAVPTKDNENEFVVGLNRSLVSVRWTKEDGSVNHQVLSTVNKEFPKSRFNDGKADTRGRLWYGTMGYESPSGDLDPNEGSLYKFTSKNLENPDVMIHPVNISNGLAWNKANDKFYYIDTPTNKVKEYDYDDATGTISNLRVAFDVNEHADTIVGHPDGMTIDSDDNLWVALYDGGAVVKVNPRSRGLLMVVPLPARYVTSVAWGGTDFATLFVTTSRYTLNDEERKRQPAAGSVFAVLNTGCRGFAANFADVLFEAKKNGTRNKRRHV